MTSIREKLTALNAYKSFESEDFLDAYFYRPLGALVALGANGLRMTPNQLTCLGLSSGVFGGCLLYWDQWMWHGIGLLIISALFDASDGQLARMTGKSSLMGRILDGVADYAVFMATYLALGLKYMAIHPETSPLPVFALMAAAGISHSLQSSLYDFYRSQYIEYVDKRTIPRSQLTAAPAETAGLLKRFLWWSHRDYTRRQEKLAAAHLALGKRLLERFPDGKIDDAAAAQYRKLNLPVIRLWNFTGPNSRLWCIALALWLGHPEVYFWAEVTLYNAWTLVSQLAQNRADRSFR